LVNVRKEKIPVVALVLRRTKVTDVGVRLLAEHCPQLRALDLGRTDVTDVGVRLLAEHCPQLESLNLGHCSGVTDAAMATLVRHCPQLHTLGLTLTGVRGEGRTALTERCPQLYILRLGLTDVTDVGVRVLAEHCPQLRAISLKNTNVTDVGVGVLAERCPQLRALRLSDTRLTDDGLQVLARRGPQLRALDLSNTAVTDVGMTALARHCPQLHTLRLSNTNVRLPRSLTSSTDAQAILQYFREAREVGRRPLLEVKVSILGLGRLGKSQLARRLAPQNDTERRQPFDTDAESTHAFVQRTTTCTLTRNRIRHECLLRLFDFGGQPEMHGAHRFFLADQRNVYIILVSARLSRAANRLDYWLRMVKRHGGGVPAIVVVSHNDKQPAADERIYHSPAEPLELLDPEKLMQEHDIPVQVVNDYSNATGENLDQVWNALHLAVNSLDPVFDVPFAPNFFKIHAWLSGRLGHELKDQPPFERYLSVQSFRNVCAAAGQEDEKQQLLWLTLLRDLGLLHYVGDRPEVKRNTAHELGQFIFHPEWVKTPVYNVVRHPEAYERAGILPYGTVSRALGPELEEADRRRIVALMEACELIFRVRGGKPKEADYLIVDRVPNRPEGMVRADWTASPRKGLRWEFPFLPSHLLPQLLGRWFSQVPADTPYFRDDVVVAGREEKPCRMRLRASIHEHTLDLEFDADRDKDWERMLARLETEVESILDPEGLWRWAGGNLWKAVDPEKTPATELTLAEERTLSAVAEALSEAHSQERDSPFSDQFRAALRRGFVDSLNMTAAEKLAYRACWAFSCSRCISDATSSGEAKPIDGETTEMENVIRWLTTHHEIKTILLAGQKRKTLDKIDALRGSYRNALATLPRVPSSQGAGDLHRHAARPDRRRRDD
jgi:hypothetical protein